MSIVVDKIARPAPYEGFPMCPTRQRPSGTEIGEIPREELKKKTTSQLDKKKTI